MSERLKVLIVDDSEPTTKIMGILFRQHGLDVVTAATLLQAQQMIGDDILPAGALIDWLVKPGYGFDIHDMSLEQYDGLGVAKMLAKKTNHRCRTVLWSGLQLNSEEVLTQLRDAGVWGWIEKPVGVEVLINLAAVFCNGYLGDEEVGQWPVNINEKYPE